MKKCKFLPLNMQNICNSVVMKDANLYIFWKREDLDKVICNFFTPVNLCQAQTWYALGFTTSQHFNRIVKTTENDYNNQKLCQIDIIYKEKMLYFKLLIVI